MPKLQDIALDALVLHEKTGRPIRWNDLFKNDQPLAVEIGSGLGEFLIREASTNTGRNHVGIELQWRRAKRTLRKVQVARKEKPSFKDNVRVLRVDATLAFERLFSPLSIEKIYCLFPCPWPKKKHIKCRLFSHAFFLLLNSRLKPKGEVDIVTDHAGYFAWIKEEAKGTGFRIQAKNIQPKFDTKFERKWCAEGQKDFYQLHLTKNEQKEVLLKKDVSLKNYFISDFSAERFKFDDISDGASIVFKDFLFDPKRNKGLVHLLVSEEHISQHTWVSIEKKLKKWKIAKAEGHTAIPTEGLKKALEAVVRAAERTKPEKRSKQKK